MSYSSANPWRQQFPVIAQQSIVYLDSAATSQKPQCVIDAVNDYYAGYNANVHRAAHQLSAKATASFEASRKKVAQFINANNSDEVIFTGGTTAGFNLLANTLPFNQLQPWQSGDEIILSTLEHHANIVPWQMIAQRQGLVIRVIELDEHGDLSMEHYRSLLNPRTRLVSVSHVSNTLGTINPVAEITRLAHDNGSLVAIDGAQASAHSAIDVAAIGCDFYLFSGHKMYAPTGIGVLWGRFDVLNSLPPWQGGGEMIKRVSFDHTEYNVLPFRLEAGTPNISAVIGLGAAIDFLNSLDCAAATQYEQALAASAKQQLSRIDGLRIIGSPQQQTSLFSFVVDDCDTSDIATLLDEQGICVRSGHHCTQPLMQALGLDGTIRASFALYNNQADVDRLVAAVKKTCAMLV